MSVDPYALDGPEAQEQAISRLLAASETSIEMRALERVGIRAGFLWACSCRAANYPTREVCSSCGKPRPSS